MLAPRLGPAEAGAMEVGPIEARAPAAGTVIRRAAHGAAAVFNGWRSILCRHAPR